MGKTSRQSAIGQAHSKLILMGEHAVVYNEPAIAIPFDTLIVKAMVKSYEGTVQFISDFYAGELEQMPDKMKGLAECVKSVCEQLNQPVENFQINLESSIPIGRGLGSSAAIAVSLVRGLYNFFKKNLNRETLKRFVDLAEKYAHGTPSGIDREATTHDHPIFFQREHHVEQVKIGEPLHLVVADTGRVGDTHASVASVKEQYQRAEVVTRKRIAHLGQLTRKARQVMESGLLVELGKLLDQAHLELQALGVSDPGLDYYVEVSKQAGALGAKLTGGGRGGCMFALVDSVSQAKVVEDALVNAGAARTWYCKVANEVMSYES
ncbi:mevalonate kinase [Amphibacillus indicireducens]|uniref:mevalonate kinase n=1 Tax=Amphibacillus indicireducens TaxID=1076330 RepID=A0ABP7VZK1_9BACI